MGPLKAPRSSGVNGAKSCYLGVFWAYISDADHMGFMCHKSDKAFFLEGGRDMVTYMCKMNKLGPIYLVNHKCDVIICGYVHFYVMSKIPDGRKYQTAPYKFKSTISILMTTSGT